MYLSAPPHNTSAANINSYAINDFKILERSHEKTRISVSILIKPDLIALCLFKDKIYLKKTSTRFGWLQIVDFSLCFIKTCVFHLGLFVIKSNSNSTHSQDSSRYLPTTIWLAFHSCSFWGGAKIKKKKKQKLHLLVIVK